MLLRLDMPEPRHLLISSSSSNDADAKCEADAKFEADAKCEAEAAALPPVVTKARIQRVSRPLSGPEL